MRMRALAGLLVFAPLLAGCPPDFEDPGVVDPGGPCKFSFDCKRVDRDRYVCMEGICTLEREAIAKRELATAEASLAEASIPEGETLNAGWFTRIRSAEGKGVAVARCASNEWLTGGSCSPTGGGEPTRTSTPRPGEDGSGRGGSWRCSVGHPDARVEAHAICAAERGESAEAVVAPAADAGTAPSTAPE